MLLHEALLQKLGVPNKINLFINLEELWNSPKEILGTLAPGYFALLPKFLSSHFLEPFALQQ
jgi:hypothetical protein